MSFEDFIDEEVIEFVNELENPKKYHYEEHSDDTIHFYEDGEEIMYEEVVDLLNEQNKRIKELEKENEELESENKMLKTTISRNEAYINRIKTISKWSNTGDVE